MEMDTCPTCGKWTSQGLEKFHKHSIEHPIFGTDFSKPLSEIIEDNREIVSHTRGQLSDIVSTGRWTESLNDVIGLLTCGLITLHYIKEEMQKVEKRQKDEEEIQ